MDKLYLLSLNAQAASHIDPVADLLRRHLKLLLAAESGIKAGKFTEPAVTIRDQILIQTPYFLRLSDLRKRVVWPVVEEAS